MSETTAIEWCTSTWNPWQGCTKVSPGCDLCYAEALSRRWGKDFTTLHRSADATFYAPLRWKTPRKIFTCSISDFFHKQADPWREEAWEIILKTPQHTYQILTKRPGLMVAWAKTHPWPEHVWAGTSVENQKYAPRLDVLARVPAKVRFVSVEPMLGPVDLQEWLGLHGNRDTDGLSEFDAPMLEPAINWVIAGGESGPGARPAHPDWFRSLAKQCKAAGVPFFFKQRGEWTWEENWAWDKDGAGPAIPLDWKKHPDRYQFLQPDGSQGTGYDGGRGVFVAKVGKKAAGALLDGQKWWEFPV